MTNLILHANGDQTALAFGYSATEAIAALVRANTIPAVLDVDGKETSPEIVPEPATLAAAVAPEDIAAHPWRVPLARTERLAVIRLLRNAKLIALDMEANHALTGRPNMRQVAAVEADRQILRDLPPIAEAALAALTITDDIDAYLPEELT